MNNQIVWVDIPVADLDRAVKFYSAVLGAEVKKQTFPGFQYGLLPYAEANASGCLVEASNENQPSRTGPLIYMNANGRLDSAIAAVEANGGAIIQPRHQIGEHGFRAIIVDSEGNRIALHSIQA